MMHKFPRTIVFLSVPIEFLCLYQDFNLLEERRRAHISKYFPTTQVNGFT